MNNLPIEIQDKIWHIYYKDIYYNKAVLKINDIIHKITTIDEYCYNIYKFFHVFSKINDDTYNKNFVENCLEYNKILFDMYNDKSSKMLLKRFNHITSHIVKILDGFGNWNIYTKYTIQFNLISAYLCIKGNYNSKFDKYIYNKLIRDRNI